MRAHLFRWWKRSVLTQQADDDDSYQKYLHRGDQ